MEFSAEARVWRLKSEDWRVAGTARSRERVEALATLGYEAFIFAVDPRPRCTTQDRLKALVR